jgi:hypothetical protein
MNYFVMREGQQYGPYSLAELQRLVTQGNFQLTDVARSEGFDRWIPLQQIIGNIAVQPPPPPVNYGQVPVYAQGSGAAVQQAQMPAGPVPVGLHWAIVLVLAVVTLGIFDIIWMFVEASYVQKLRTGSKVLVFYLIGVILILFAGFADAGGVKEISGLLQLAGSILILVGHFSMRSALEEYYTSVEPINLQLSGVMTFFFNTVYFQYHLSKIRKWKLTGELT